MEPLTLTVLMAVAGYCVAAPDRRTFAASRGTAGAVRAAAIGGTRQVREDWRAGRPYRAATGQRIRAKFRRRKIGAVAVALWDCARFAGRAGRGTARVGYRTGRAAASSARSGYGPAAARAKTKRARKLARRRLAAKKRAAAVATQPSGVATITAPPVPPTPVPTPGAGSTTTLTTPGDDDMKLLTMNPGELLTTSDLRGESRELNGILEELREALAHLNEYLAGVGDRYAGAPFGTEKLSRAISSLGEQARAVDPVVIDHIVEDVGALDEALTEADALAEHASAVKAEGEIHAFQPA